MRKRPRKKTDNANTQTAVDLLEALVKAHPEIEVTLWFGATQAMCAASAVNSGWDYDAYFDEVLSAVKHYKCLWEEIPET